MSLTGVKVLVVEDDPALRSLYRNMLSRERAEVLEAADGRQGLEAFAQGRPDVVVSDLMMPRLDGVAMVQSLLDLGQRPAVVFVTGTRHALEASDGGACLVQEHGYQVLRKPFGRRELLESLRHALARDEEPLAAQA
jgi:CheY-like chemotaxis protein